MNRLVLVLVVCGPIACGGGGGLPTGPTPVTATLEIRYLAAAADPPASSELPCVGPVSAQPSFWGFAPATMAEVKPGAWVVFFDDVPLGRHEVRIRAPEGCVGSALFANGEPIDGGFTLHADGRVTP